jgi:4-amino-4-deoxy-L-arabinose transferase-like glycosyltransferase
VLTGFITALDALAVGGLYLCCRRGLGEAVALVAALLFAVNPLAVHYARKIWAPDLMPPFTVLLLAGLLAALGEGSAWGLAAVVVALAVLVQLHQAAVVLAAVAAALVIVFAPRLPWRRAGFWLALAGGSATAVALLWPYGRYEVSHQLADLHGMAQQVSAPATLTGAPWLDLWQLLAGWNPELFFAPLAAQEHPSLAGSGLVDWLALGVALLGLATCAAWVVRPEAVRSVAAGGLEASPQLVPRPPLKERRRAAPSEWTKPDESGWVRSDECGQPASAGFVISARSFRGGRTGAARPCTIVTSKAIDRRIAPGRTIV